MTAHQQTTDKPRWRDYLELCKPRVVALMILTAVVGMCLSTSGPIPLSAWLWGNLGIAFCAGAAATINHVVDRYIDSKMKRTHQRPVVQGRVSTRAGLCFAATLALIGLAVLLSWVNELTAILTLCASVIYAGIYSLFLKHATDQNIVIGGIAGAAPPLLGWVAVTGQCSSNAFLLVLIIFVWTPPHFWALAIHRVDDYRRASVPMLPVRKGVPYTCHSIVCYVWMLIAVTWLPVATGLADWLYLLISSIINILFLKHAYRLKKSNGKEGAMACFRYSITYLMILFLALLIDHYLMIT